MAADRQVPTSSTVGAVTGDSYMDAVSEEVTKLYDVSFITLGSVSVTLETDSTFITATITPALTGSLVDGMKFTLPMGGSDSVGNAALSLDGGSTYYDIVENDGTATATADLKANARVPLEWDNTNSRFVILHPAAATLGASLDYQSFTASGTWTKPTGLAANALVIVEAWGGGGGGTTSQGGGGGGAYVRRAFRASELGSTETVTIGSGGSTGSAGGNTTFGSLVTAYGGGGTTAQGGGGGGGALSAGTTVSTSTGGAGGNPGGSAAGVSNSGYGGGGGGSSGAAGGSSAIGGGGGGGNGGNFAGGASLFGGGGGGGAGGSSAGGQSIYGGNGGGNGSAGSAPGGGGGAGGAGARGECRVLVIG